MLNSKEEVYSLRTSFDAQKCMEFVWATYDDLRCFFNQRMVPDDFGRPEIVFPTSLLDSLYEPEHFADNVRRVNFPVQWIQKRDDRQHREKQGRGYGHGSGGGSVRFRMGAEKEFKDDTDIYCRQTGEEFKHMHPKLRKALQEFHKKFNGRVMLQEIMTQAGITWDDMPKLPATVN